MKSIFGPRLEPRDGMYPISLGKGYWCIRIHDSGKFTLDDLDWLVRSRESCGWGLLEGFYTEYRIMDDGAAILKFWDYLKNVRVLSMIPGLIRILHRGDYTVLSIRPNSLCTSRRVGVRDDGRWVRRVDCLESFYNISLVSIEAVLGYFIVVYRVEVRG